MAKMYPPVTGMKGTENIEVYVYDNHTSSVHHLFCPPLPVHSHLQLKNNKGNHSSSNQRPSMLAVSQLKALLSPGRQGRRIRTPKAYYSDDDDGPQNNEEIVEHLRTPETTGSRRTWKTSEDYNQTSSNVLSLYYQAPLAASKPSHMTRSPRVTRQTQHLQMMVVSKDGQPDQEENFSESLQSNTIIKDDLCIIHDIHDKALEAQQQAIVSLENNLNECIISVAVTQATDKVQLQNKIAELKSAIVYSTSFQEEILLKKAIELDERMISSERRLEDLELLARTSDRTSLREDMDRKFFEIGNYLDEFRALEEIQEQRTLQILENEGKLTAERDALRALVSSCTAEIASLKERLDSTESIVRNFNNTGVLKAHPLPTVMEENHEIEQNISEGNKNIRMDSEVNNEDITSNIIKQNDNDPIENTMAPPLSPDRDGSVWVDEPSVSVPQKNNGDLTELSSLSVQTIDQHLNSASVIQSKIRDNETLLIRLNSVRAKIKSEIINWCNRFEEETGRSPTDADKVDILPLYKAYHEATLLFKQTLKELDSLKQQHDELREQIKISSIDKR